MNVQMVFRIFYDKDKDGSLREFRTKKYLPFKAHIERLQTSGTLPRGEVFWSVQHKTPEPPKTDGPATVFQFQPPHGAFSPVIVHEAGHRLGGTRIDPLRIAI